VTVSIDTATAAVFATTASTTSTNLMFDINGDGVVDRTDVDFYLALADAKVISNSVIVVNEGISYSDGAYLTFSSPDIVGGTTATGYISYRDTGAISKVNILDNGSGYFNTSTIVVNTASSVVSIVTSGTISTTTLYISTSTFLDNIYVRMAVFGPGIADGTTVVSKNTNSVVLSTLPVGIVTSSTFVDIGRNASFITNIVSDDLLVDPINEKSNYPMLLNQHITLNIDNGIQDNVRLMFVKRSFEKATIWNDQVSISGTKSLLESTTLPARFLQAKLAELPDIYYYGASPALNINSGLALTDENNEPLEGL
jgi:hypothetical protein